MNSWVVVRMGMNECVLCVSFLFLSSSYCFDVKNDKDGLESRSSSFIEVMSDTRIDNALLKQLLEENRHLLKRVHHLELENANRKKEIDELKIKLLPEKEYINSLEEAPFEKEIGNSIQSMDAPGKPKLSATGERHKTSLKDNSKSPSVTEAVSPPQDHFKSRIRRVMVDLEVAFFATRSIRQTHMGSLQNVLFNNVETNKGNGYDPSIGVFLAPETGTYVFSTTIVISGHSSSHFGIFKNTRKVTILWVNGSENGWDSSSQTVILSLNKGDDVTVKHIDIDREIYGDHHCIFSGFLLFQDESVVSSIVG